jgi:hypothetical protein
MRVRQRKGSHEPSGHRPIHWKKRIAAVHDIGNTISVKTPTLPLMYPPSPTLVRNQSLTMAGD